jgi:hypothetical protein
MKNLMAIAALSLMATLVAATSASAAPSRALYGTQKIAANACAQTSGCTGWTASCRGPNSRRQWKCKAVNYIDTATCLIGLTWVQGGGKLYLAKYGTPQCY